MNKKLVITLLVLAAVAGCASNNKYVPRDQAYRSLSFGTVVASEEATIGGTHSGIGSYVGSAAAIHDSTSHSFIGFVLRGLAGAIVGSIAEEAVTREPGMLYTVETANGRMLEILSTNKKLVSGDCVQIGHAGHRHTTIASTDAANCINQQIQKTVAKTTI